jgi:hypothetical protein
MWRSIVDSIGRYGIESISALLALLIGLLLMRRSWKHRQQRREYRKRERVRHEFWSPS